MAEWRSFSASGARPADVPAIPFRIYAEEWTSWGDFLGTGIVSTRKRKNRPFEAARAFARSLGLRTKGEWKAFARGERRARGRKRPSDIPSAPEHSYKGEGWKDYGDWLGTDIVPPGKRTYRPFVEAREFARSLGFTRSPEWTAYARGKLTATKGTKPADIPAVPWLVYRGEYVNMGDWLGTGHFPTKNRVFRPFEAARTFVRALGLGSLSEWEQWSRGELPEKGTRPHDIPGDPRRAYQGVGWRGYADWLGFQDTPRPFSAARAFVRSLGLKSAADWREYAAGRRPDVGRRPKDIPAGPPKTYGAEWLSWYDWLGTGPEGKRGDHGSSP